MINKNYQKQVSLLLKVLPEVAKETCFALHGGTAINLSSDSSGCSLILTVQYMLNSV